MPTYTVEMSGFTPYVVRETIEADSVEAALAEAERMLAEDPIDFGAAELLRECDTPARVTGLWAGVVTHHGDDLRPPAVIAATDAAIAHDVAPDPVRDAAPDMLTALETASEALAMLAAHASPLPPYKGEKYIHAHNVICAALAKAEGRS